jgi:putative hydrolase of the HAD superfamily
MKDLKNVVRICHLAECMPHIRKIRVYANGAGGAEAESGLDSRILIGHDPMTSGQIDDWVFDLDNTLYPRHCDLFGQIDVRMTAYVARLTGLSAENARLLQKRLYRDHGTTLNGLMHEYGVDPHGYLADVHDIDYSAIDPDPALGAAIAALPGRKHVFTNGDLAHAERTLTAIGIAMSAFDSVFDIVAADFEPKPRRGAYERFVERSRVEPRNSVMFEDLARNLAVPKEMGMTTVLILPKAGGSHRIEAFEMEGRDDPHIDHTSDDLAAFLTRAMTAP